MYNSSTMRNHAGRDHSGYMRVSHDKVLDRLRSDADLRVALENSIQLIRRRRWLHDPSSQAALRRPSRKLARSKVNVCPAL